MALAIMIAVWTPASSWSAEPTENKMMQKCEEMKKEKRKMQAEVKAQDAELAIAVATMNSAAPDKKLDLAAALVTRMVEQSTALHAQKAKMEEKMMEHMEKGEGARSKCPMMKGADEKAE